jgi:hypothetical protein
MDGAVVDGSVMDGSVVDRARQWIEGSNDGTNSGR